MIKKNLQSEDDHYFRAKWVVLENTTHLFTSFFIIVKNQSGSLFRVDERLLKKKPNIWVSPSRIIYRHYKKVSKKKKKSFGISILFFYIWSQVYNA